MSFNFTYLPQPYAVQNSPCLLQGLAGTNVFWDNPSRRDKIPGYISLHFISMNNNNNKIHIQILTSFSEGRFFILVTFQVLWRLRYKAICWIKFKKLSVWPLGLGYTPIFLKSNTHSQLNWLFERSRDSLLLYNHDSIHCFLEITLLNDNTTTTWTMELIYLQFQTVFSRWVNSFIFAF